MVLLSTSVSSDTVTPETIPSDSEFYTHSFVVQCRAAASHFHGWENVDWFNNMSLSYWTDEREHHVTTARGEIDTDRGRATVWAECTYTDATGAIEVHNFAAGPFHHTFMEPNEENSTEPTGSDATDGDTSGS